MEQPSGQLLLVDDDRGDYLLVRDMLAEVAAPYQLEWASDYEAGLAAVRACRHDAYLLDYRLGDGSGLDLLREAVAAGCGGPLILLTGQGDRETDLEAMRAGADDYLPKDRLSGALLERAVRYAVERRAARERLRLRDRALEAISQGLCIAEARPPLYPVVYANPGLERLTGYAREELIGQGCPLFAGPDTDPAEQTRLWEAIRARRPATAELLGYRKDGTTFWTSVSLSPFAGASAGAACCACVFTDLSEHRRLEAQARQAQKMEAVGRLAGGVAHDFNNTMTIVSGFGELVLAGLGEEHPLAPQVRDILKAAERASNLTSQLLAFGRKSLVMPRVMDLNAFLGEMVPMLGRLIGADVRLEMALRAANARVKADPGHMHQVVLNLALNARDAMPNGGRLVLETAEVDLDEGAARQRAEAHAGRYVRLTVRDTGQGMSEEVRAHVFEPFYTTKDVGKGTGLGLAVVHGIAQQAGGHVELESREGEGSAFHVYLPRTEGEAAPGAVQKPAAWPRGTETVLLAEDEPAVRAVVTSVLRQCGYGVLEAGDGEEALRVAAEYAGPIHLLVSDVVMPRLGGSELAGRLTAQRPGLRVLYLSAHTEDEVVRRGVAERGATFLAKPFKIDDLARKVREVLDG